MLEEPLVHTVSNPEDYSPEKPKEIISSTPKKCVCEICTCGKEYPTQECIIALDHD